ncbi:MAG TPA: MHYT domain-containing protein [Gammaproteobacteria bacterium]|jgi:diguanylate cyclase (GGDEF)-like protein
MEGVYDLRLVVLSVAVAIFASYTALDLAGRVSDSSGRAGLAWLVGGAISMGFGIWSMHFIGMLAFSLPIPMAYDTPLTLLSLLIGMVVSGIALFVVRSPSMTTRNLSTGAMLMGVGIASMHYTGMYAMRMSPPIQYDPLLFVASVLIAIGASLAALWIAFQLRRRHSVQAVFAKLGSAMIMGLAIVGMHYTGMAAANFAPDSVCLAADSTSLSNAALALVIGICTISVMVITQVISSFDTYVAAHSARLASSLKAANEQLRNMALHDPLTGLPNRVLLDDRLEQAIRSAARDRHEFAVLFVDLDRFKPVNDAHGHKVGDELLKVVAHRLRNCLRGADTVARTGGDEFVVVLHRIQSEAGVKDVGEKILAELSRPFGIGGLDLEISCSIGASIYPRDGIELQTLVVKADAAMYSAKNSGRRRLSFHDGTAVPDGAR